MWSGTDGTRCAPASRFLLRFRNAGRSDQCEGKKEDRSSNVCEVAVAQILSHEFDGDQHQSGITDPG